MEGPQLTFEEPLYPNTPSGLTQNGISFQRSSVRMSEITDGASKTLMVGEKFRNPNTYFTGTDPADNQCVFSGHDSDNNGYTGIFDDGRVWVYAPLQDRPLPSSGFHHYFGSAHAEGFHIAYCDGSVHFIDYGIAPPIWYVAGGRNDEDKYLGP
jgi:prepilin-type processing-associated H-X9-DG protein